MKVQTRSFLHVAAPPQTTLKTHEGRMRAALKAIDDKVNEFLADLDIDPSTVTITVQEQELADGSISYIKTVVYAL